MSDDIIVEKNKAFLRGIELGQSMGRKDQIRFLDALLPFVSYGGQASELIREKVDHMKKQ